MKISLISAISENNVIGSGPDIPWEAEGEQLIFKALTYNQWLLLGRKTFESVGVLPDRRYAVISRSKDRIKDKNVLVFNSVEEALKELPKITKHIFVSGGGQIYKALIGLADVLHLSVIHLEVEGNIVFPAIPRGFKKIFSQEYELNINYTYQIWDKIKEWTMGAFQFFCKNRCR